MYSAIDLCMKMSYNVSVSFPTLICHMPTTPLHSLACLFPCCFNFMFSHEWRAWFCVMKAQRNLRWCPASMSNISDHSERGRGGGLHICLNATLWESMKTDCFESSNRFLRSLGVWIWSERGDWMYEEAPCVWRGTTCRAVQSNIWKSDVSLIRKNSNKAPRLKQCACVLCVSYIFKKRNKDLWKKRGMSQFIWCCLTLRLQERLFLALPEAKCR